MAGMADESPCGQWLAELPRFLPNLSEDDLATFVSWLQGPAADQLGPWAVTQRLHQLVGLQSMIDAAEGCSLIADAVCVVQGKPYVGQSDPNLLFQVRVPA